jgi:hypothetical protein
MWWWGVAALLVASGAEASAQPADLVAATDPAASPAPVPAIGYGAMPGGLHVPSAETLPKGAIEITALSGFGMRKTLLGPDHQMSRTIGTLAVAFAPTPLLTIALSLDGRYDTHSGGAAGTAPKTDDGYVGDPHLLARAAKPFGNVKLGGQLGIWVPGADAPSIAAKAISVDVRGIATLAAGPGELSFDAGFRLDDSAKSVDRPSRLSVQDRVSLGVSDYSAVVVGAHLRFPAGQAFASVEGSVDYFIGSEAPGAIFRGGISGGYRITNQWSVLAFVEGAKVPGIADSDVMRNVVPLIPYEPVVTGGLALQARFGGPAGSGLIVNAHPTAITVIETADLSGDVVDETGKPVIGAKVNVTLKNVSKVGNTDDKGHYTIDKLPIGRTVGGTTVLDDTAAAVSVEVAGKKQASTTLTLAKGGNSVTKLSLEPVLPPGQLRAVVRSLVTGKPLAGATVKIEPGGVKATSGADGTVSVDLAPGSYKIKVTSPGLEDQELDVTIDPNGVAIKNIELHR